MRISLMTLIIVLSASASCFADIIVEVQNGSISTGGIGFIDVLISSDATDNLFQTAYHFEITGSAANGSLQFRSDPFQTNDQQSVIAPAPYVFGADIDPGNFFATRQDPTLTQIIGGDNTQSGAGVSLTSTQLLLTRLYVEHITGTPLAAVGDIFTIKLINNDNSTPGDFTDDSTQFKDDLMNNLTIDPLSYSGSGTITISSAAVPEPSTFAALATVVAAILQERLRRRKVQVWQR
ncbi:MAG: hypothetical protein U0936_09375 [Planctomycetaceae bacterium]